MARVLEADIRISAVDATGDTFRDIANKVKGLQSTFKALSGVASAGTSGANRAISRLHSAVSTMAPAASAAAAFEGARGIRDIVHATVQATAAQAHEQVREMLSGMPENERADASRLSLELSQRYQMFSQTTVMHALRNMRAIVGTYEEATRLLDPMLKLRAVTLAAHPELKEEIEGDMDKLMKSEEIIGATQDPGRFTRDMGAIQRAMGVFGDTLRPYDFFEFAQHSRAAGQAFGEDFLFGVGPTLMQHMGGAQAGTAMSALFQQFAGGHMTQAAANMMNKYHLLNPGMIEFNKSGLVKRVQPGALVGSDLFKSDPYEWIQKVLLPHLRAGGITTKEQLEDVGAVLASRQTTGQALGILGTQQANIEKDRALWQNAPHADDAMRDIKNDPYMGVAEVSAQLENLLAIAGGPMAKPAAEAMNMIADGIVHLENVAKEHPYAGAAGLAGAIGALGTGSVLLGAYGLRAGARWLGYGAKAPIPPIDDLDAARKAAEALFSRGGPAAAEVAGGGVFGTALASMGLPLAIGSSGYDLSRKAADMASAGAFDSLADKNNPMLGAMSGDYALAGAINSQQAEVKGSADLNVKVEVEPSDSFISRLVSALRNEINAFDHGGTAGSTGVSMPEAVPGP